MIMRIGHALRLPVHIVMLTFIVGLMAACNTGTSTPGTSSVVDLQVSGTAQVWTGGAAALRAIGTNRDDVEFVSQGSITADGDFILELPEPLSLPDSFGPLTCEAGETGELKVTLSTMMVSLVRSFDVMKTRDLDGPDMGEVLHIKGDRAGSDGFTLGMYAYASTPGTVKGTCIFVDKTSTHTFDLTLAAGWNHVVVTFTDPTTDFVATYRTTALPENLNWVYYKFPPPPHEGPPPSPLAPGALN